MSLTIASMRSYYEKLFDTCVINKESAACVIASVKKIVDHRHAYMAVGDDPKINVPWYFIGIIHMLEGGCDFGTHLHNGDSLNTRTVHVPPGRPKSGTPPFSWEFSAKDAMAYEGFLAKNWDLGSILFRFEQYNGWGYWKRGMPSAYLWSCSNHYKKGKYVKDGKFDPNAVSKQIGAACLLKQMNSDKTIQLVR